MKNVGCKAATVFFFSPHKKKKTQEKSDLKATQNEKQHQMRKNWQLHNGSKDSEDIATSNTYFLFFFVRKLAFGKKTSCVQCAADAH